MTITRSWEVRTRRLTVNEGKRERKELGKRARLTGRARGRRGGRSSKGQARGRRGGRSSKLVVVDSSSESTSDSESSHAPGGGSEEGRSSNAGGDKRRRLLLVANAQAAPEVPAQHAAWFTGVAPTDLFEPDKCDTVCFVCEAPVPFPLDASTLRSGEFLNGAVRCFRCYRMFCDAAAGDCCPLEVDPLRKDSFLACSECVEQESIPETLRKPALERRWP